MNYKVLIRPGEAEDSILKPLYFDNIITLTSI